MMVRVIINVKAIFRARVLALMLRVVCVRKGRGSAAPLGGIWWECLGAGSARPRFRRFFFARNTEFLLSKKRGLRASGSCHFHWLLFCPASAGTVSLRLGAGVGVVRITRLHCGRGVSPPSRPRPTKKEGEVSSDYRALPTALFFRGTRTPFPPAFQITLCITK